MSSNLLVPHHPQQADGYCLPACVQMVLAFCGINRRQSRLARQLQTIPGAGTPGSRLRRLASRTLDISYGSGTLDDLRAALAQGIPPITLVNTRHFNYWSVEAAHAVVVISMDETTVVINDPGIEQGSTVVSIGDFYLAWDDMANLYGLVRKK